MNEPIENPIVTAQLIEDLKTEAGGWTRKSLAYLGVPWPPEKGWQQEISNKSRQPIEYVKTKEELRQESQPKVGAKVIKHVGAETFEYAVVEIVDENRIKVQSHTTGDIHQIRRVKSGKWLERGDNKRSSTFYLVEGEQNQL